MIINLTLLNYIIGIDEAGRGPWAGPVTVGGFLVPEGFDFSIFPGLTDSKKCTEKDRERLYDLIEKQKEKGGYASLVSQRSAHEIDILGIREANRQAMEDVILHLVSLVPKGHIYQIKIDGRDNYTFRNIDPRRVEYIVKGDLKEKVISAASILAKVTRDREMRDFSLKYPLYHFELHKGYGTRKHQEALLHYGITPIHRKTYAPIKRLISSDS